MCLQLQRHLAVLPAARYPDAHIALALAEARLALSERRADKAQACLEACLVKPADEPASSAAAGAKPKPGKRGHRQDKPHTGLPR